MLNDAVRRFRWLTQTIRTAELFEKDQTVEGDHVRDKLPGWRMQRQALLGAYHAWANGQIDRCRHPSIDLDALRCVKCNADLSGGYENP